jgi:F0F1-type ATP synthase membrane subunit b/b'
MKNENRENPQQLSPEELKNRKPETGESSPPEEYLRMKEWIRQAQSDAERARVHSEQAHSDIAELRSELHNQGRKTKGTGWTTALLLVALLGVCAYGYLTLQGQGSLLAQLPGVQKSVDAVVQRMDGTENQIRSWATSWGGLTDRVGQVEQGVNANLRAAKDFAAVQAAKVQHELQGEMDNRTQSIDAKLSQLESSQHEDRVQLATLQQQVGNVRSEAHQQLASAQQENGREFGNVRNEINQNRDDLSTVARNLDRQRMNFEVSKKQSQELAPGLAFTVLKTDVSHQQVDGYLHLIPEGRFLWVHGQGIEQPMLFHNQDDKRAYEVVFTRVAQDSAVGYVLMPRWPATEMPVATNPSGPQPSSASVQ